MAKISQSRNKNVTSNDSNVIHAHAKRRCSTVIFCFHVRTEIPEIYGYCFRKPGSWQESLVKEENIFFDACRIMQCLDDVFQNKCFSTFSLLSGLTLQDCLHLAYAVEYFQG